MRQRGFDLNDKTTDVTKPQGIGNVAAAVIEYRHADGANQLGDELGGTTTETRSSRGETLRKYNLSVSPCLGSENSRIEIFR